MKTAALTLAAVLTFNAMDPALAHAATRLRGTDVGPDSLALDAYVVVTYRYGKRQERSSKGWIDAIGTESFSIRDGDRRITIAFANVSWLIISQKATTPAQGMIEVESYIRKMEAAGSIREMSHSELDRSMLSPGSYVSVVYTSEGVRKISSGKIVANKPDHLVVQSAATPWKKWKIVYGDIEILAVYDSWREIDTWRRAKKAMHRLEEPDSRVRIKAPSILKGWIKGRIIRATVDTLLMLSTEGSTMIPISSIDRFDVSFGRQSNTKKGLVIGLVSGAVASIWIDVRDDARGYESEQAEEMIDGLTALLIVPAATLAGTLIGAAIETEKWVEVSPSRINLSVSPTRDKGLRAAVSFEF